jgi:hypothetical protein
MYHHGLVILFSHRGEPTVSCAFCFCVAVVAAAPFMEGFPSELNCEVLSGLSICEVIDVSGVSRAWREFVESNFVWWLGRQPVGVRQCFEGSRMKLEFVRHHVDSTYCVPRVRTRNFG